jgi:hypothetical protein
MNWMDGWRGDHLAWPVLVRARQRARSSVNHWSGASQEGTLPAVDVCSEKLAKFRMRDVVSEP